MLCCSSSTATFCLHYIYSTSLKCCWPQNCYFYNGYGMILCCQPRGITFFKKSNIPTNTSLNSAALIQGCIFGVLLGAGAVLMYFQNLSHGPAHINIISKNDIHIYFVASIMQLKNPSRRQCPFSCKVQILITMLTPLPAGKVQLFHSSL